jgi:hypothetical protein
MRLKRGTIAGEKRGGHWVVYLPGPTQQPPTIDHTPPERPTHHPTERDPTPDQTAPEGSPVAAMRETIGILRSEVDFLREQLDHSRRELAAERERFDVIHREALARLEALTAGDDARASDTGPVANAAPGANGEAAGGPVPLRRAWWRVWGR